jgi:hypothetical protein
MMQFFGSDTFWFYGLLHLVTWILLVGVLISLIRWLWKKGDNETKRR